MNDDTAAYEAAVTRVMRHLTRDLLLEVGTGVVDIASPTGHEAPLANWIAAHLTDHGVDADLQPLDERQANAVGTVPGGDGPSVLLYAPLDTFTTGEAALDVPAAGPELRPDMRARATVHGDLIEGLGAGNPKGHAAVIIAVAEALAASGVELPGEVVVGFGAGGMPSFAVPGAGVEGRENTGHGVGAGFLLERGHTTDYAVIAKPGWTVSHEEVGLVWLDVHVPGIHTYVGSRHRLPYHNAVTDAGAVAAHLERWLESYAAEHEFGTMRPQGVVSSIRGGLTRLAASTPAEVTLRLDLRITTRQNPAAVVREVRRELDRLRDTTGIATRVQQVAAIPATHTPPSSPIVQATVAALEEVSGQPHQPIRANSGATDANILRMRGVPTARVGMPKVLTAPDGGEVDFTRGMNLVDLQQMRRLAEILCRTVLALPRMTRRENRAGGTEARPA